MSDVNISLTSSSTNEDLVPRHIAIVMDGNGRWAQHQGMTRVAGHKRGLESARKIVKASIEYNIKYLTLFAFSSENWRRPETEVKFLMKIFANALERRIKKLHQNGVRLRVIGDLNRFGEKIQGLIRKAEGLTRNNDSLYLTIAANYGGRWDMTQACQNIAQQVADKKINKEDVNEDLITSYLSTSDTPAPDLFIRTGGEQRISNFLLWDIAYSELYFTRCLWPEFNETEFQNALHAYAGRQRRYGSTGEQIQNIKKNA